MRVFGNRVLRGIYGPKKDEVTGEWRRLHNEELHNLNSPLPDKKNREWDGQGVWHVWGSRKMHTGFGRKIKGRRWAEHVACMGKRGAYMVFMGRPEGKRPI